LTGFQSFVTDEVNIRTFTNFNELLYFLNFLNILELFNK